MIVSSASSSNNHHHHHHHHHVAESCLEQQQFQQEREYYINKIDQLEEFIKSSALLVLKEETSLIQIVQSNDGDAMADIDELRERIEHADSSSSSSSSSDDESSSSSFPNLRSTLTRKLSDFRSSVRSLSDSERSTRSNIPVVQQQKKASKLSPEKALSFAIRSISGSIEHFENEREILVSKLERLQVESNTKEERLTKELKDTKNRCQALEQERDELSKMCQEQSKEMEFVQSLKDQIETLEGEKDALEVECEQKDNEITFLMTKELQWKKKNLELEQKQEQQYEIQDEFDTFGLLEEVKEERDALEQKCEEQTREIEELKETNAELQNSFQQSSNNARQGGGGASGRFSSFRSSAGRFRNASEAVERAADSWRYEDTKAKFQDLQDAYLKLQSLSSDQKDRIVYLERQNAQLQSDTEEYLLDLEQGNTKCQSLSKAVVLFSEQEESLRQRICELEEEVQTFICVNKTQTESIAVMRQTAQQKEVETSAAWDRMTTKLDALEDENERLSAKCNSLEHCWLEASSSSSSSKQGVMAVADNSDIVATAGQQQEGIAELFGPLQ